MLRKLFWHVPTVFKALAIWGNGLLNESEKRKQIRKVSGLN